MTPTQFDYVGTDVEVTDGDTVRLTLGKAIDAGFGIVQDLFQRGVRLRLAGMDAKPVHTPDGDRATAYVVAWRDRVYGIHVVTVKNALGEDKHEKYGRYLAYLFEVTKDGAMVVPSLNERMIADGVAKSWDGRGPHPE